MDVLIIEDERHAADKLIKMLESAEKEIKIVSVIESVHDSVEWLMANPAPDLIFMDIQLDDGICFEIFEAVKIITPVIFTTAFSEFAIRAFKVNSIDYLLKPVEADSLRSALKKFRNLYPAQSTQNARIEELFSQLVTSYKTRFFVKAGGHSKSLPVNEIKYFTIIERATFIVSDTGNHFDLDYSLDQLQKMLDPSFFFRINRTNIININYIQDIVTYSTSRLKIRIKDEKDNPDLVVSRDKVPDFRSWLDK